MLLEPNEDIIALSRGPGPNLREQAIMDYFATTSSIASGVVEISASVEEMHHVSLCRNIYCEVPIRRRPALHSVFPLHADGPPNPHRSNRAETITILPE